MAIVIDFLKAIHEHQRPEGYPWNNYDVAFIDPSGRERVWNLDAPDEEALRNRLKAINGMDCKITRLRLIGYARSGKWR